jgi:hypothetical protein
MTPSEFKITHPEYSHLEGIDLWNKMEDTFISNHKNDNPEIIKDWMGNVIDEGMEIVFIQTKKTYMQFGMFIPLQDGTHKEMYADKIPDEECWEVSEPVKIFKDDGGLRFETNKGEYTFIQPLSMVKFLIGQNTLLGIKGISDTKQQDNGNAYKKQTI